MKIEQQPKFQPITITLETAKDAEVFWDMVNKVGSRADCLNLEAKEMATQISNWMSFNAQLRGE